ncbi:MAG: YgeY family selenium metabolism-linked hydrolase [Anaerolineae bacterium]|nr:YgeY family selenium metabolism-linked hydrolase [Anaerolineae bacterium]
MALSKVTVDDQGVVRFAQKLVRIPSVSTHEGAVAQAMVSELEDAGCDEVHIDALGNVIGRVGSGEGPVLLFDGHMDTVGVGEVSCWERDPFGGEIADGVLYGRGAADMKGGLASMVYAAKAVARAKARLGGTLYVVGVVQEEPCEGMGIQHAIDVEGLQPDWVVLGEPTNLQIARGHRGRIALEITVRGRACHASMPQQGVNAIYQAARVVVGVELLAAQLGEDSFLGKGSIAVTDIRSIAGSRNAVPDACSLYLDRRLTGGETGAKAIAELRSIISREGVQASIQVDEHRATSYTGHQVHGRQEFAAWVTPANHPLVTTATSVVERTLGYVPRVTRWEFSTDGVYTAGVAGLPTIGFGPGEERYAHTSEEQVRIRDLQAAARVYAELALRLLGES